jgi:predicted nucleic acid-binding protein
MRFVVADAGPLHYLVLTGDIALLPSLFAKVLTPERVHHELAHAQAPEAVRAWIAMPPPWLEICPVEGGGDADDLAALDAGERDAIALALATKADLVLMDDQGGVAAARRRGFAVTGTLGLLDLAARKGLVDLAAAFARLKATSFYYRQGLLDALLAEHKAKKP